MKPLDGVKVITLEHATAAPFCTRQLADPGARVIKIERPGVGDFARVYDAPRRGWVCRTSTNGVSSARRFYWSLNSPSIPASVPTRNAWQHARNCEKSSSPHSAMLISEELISRLDTAQIASARMNDMPDVWSHPQPRERNRWVSIDCPCRRHSRPAAPRHQYGIRCSVGRRAR